MKKLLLLMGIMLSIFFFVSCNQEDEPMFRDAEPNVVKIDTAMQAFKQQVYNLNTEFGFNDKSTRISIFNRIFKFFVSVVIADATGAFIGYDVAGTTGAIVGGVVSSILVGCVQDRIPDPHVFPSRHKSRVLTQGFLNGLFFKNNNLTKEDSLGLIHNMTIYQMSINDTTLLASSATYQRENLVDSVYSYDYSVNYIPEINDTTIVAIDSMVRAFTDYCIYMDDFTTCPNTNYWNNNEDMFELISDYAQNVSSTDDNDTIWHYTSKYLTIIASSNLTNRQKILLSVSIIVGHASKKLWSEDFFIIPE